MNNQNDRELLELAAKAAGIEGNYEPKYFCAACFDPQQHDVAVLKQQRDELLKVMRGLRDAFLGTSVEVQADAMRAARAAIAKAGGES